MSNAAKLDFAWRDGKRRQATYEVTCANKEFAIRLGMRYPHRVPKWEELVDSEGMSKATACRWVRAFKDAKGEP